MKKLWFSIVILMLLSSFAQAQSKFKKHFTDQSMRIDFVLAGNKLEQSAYLLHMKQEAFWGGSRINMIDRFEYGTYRFTVSEPESNKMLYSRGFCTLFEEWRFTEEAQHVNKAFFQTVNFPYPKHEVNFKLEERQKDGTYKPIMSFKIDPNDENISKENPPKFEIVKVIDGGKAENMVDFAFVAEGYAKSEMDQFVVDVKNMANYILSQEPYKSHRKKFNFWAICSPSENSGTDNPRENKWQNTAVNSMFNTFYIDRYLETEDVIAIRDIASCTPYDHICVLVNSDKYGGGGIYNHFSISTAHHPLSKEVMLHEIGHGFAGLADEYYTSSVAYQDYFDLETEPWQPNITTLVNFESKWKHLINPGVPIPTPLHEKYKNKTGVFEGGGYVEKGVYRPAVDCMMKSVRASGFCETCQEVIANMILFVSD